MKLDCFNLILLPKTHREMIFAMQPVIRRQLTSLLSQASLGTIAPVSMVRRVHQCMCNIDHGSAAPPASGQSGASVASRGGVMREQLVVFLADALRGTAEERAPLVLSMSQPGAGSAKTVTGQQVAEVSPRNGEWNVASCFGVCVG